MFPIGLSVVSVYWCAGVKKKKSNMLLKSGSHFHKTKQLTKQTKNEVIIIILLKHKHSVHLLIFNYISVPHPSRSQSRLYSHQSTHLPLLPSCFWPDDGSPIATDFSPSATNSECSYALSEMSYFSCLKNQEHLASQTRFCGTLGRSSYIHIQSGLTRTNQAECDPYSLRITPPR